MGFDMTVQEWAQNMRKNFQAAVDLAVLEYWVAEWKRPFWSACWAWLRDDLS